MIKQLFCSHIYKVLSEHTETYTEEMTETVGSDMFKFARTVTDFWGQPLTRTRTRKTVVLSCEKCGKTITKIL